MIVIAILPKMRKQKVLRWVEILFREGGQDSQQH
jgi:hypothetical protein